MKRSVGCVLFIQNKFLVQKRSNKKNIYFPNLYGVFGGGLNSGEKFPRGIQREIYEELGLNFDLKEIKYFLKISINSKHFKKFRIRKYYSIRISNKHLKLIKLNEGQSFHLLSIKQIKKLNFVPWDLSAILYFNNYIKINKNVKLKKI